MNQGETAFCETRMPPVALFIVSAVALIVVALMIILAVVIVALVPQPDQLGITDINQVFDTGGLAWSV